MAVKEPFCTGNSVTEVGAVLLSHLLSRSPAPFLFLSPFSVPSSPQALKKIGYTFTATSEQRTLLKNFPHNPCLNWGLSASGPSTRATQPHTAIHSATAPPLALPTNDIYSLWKTVGQSCGWRRKQASGLTILANVNR